MRKILDFCKRRLSSWSSFLAVRAFFIFCLTVLVIFSYGGTAEASSFYQETEAEETEKSETETSEDEKSENEGTEEDENKETETEKVDCEKLETEEQEECENSSENEDSDEDTLGDSIANKVAGGVVNQVVSNSEMANGTSNVWVGGDDGGVSIGLYDQLFGIVSDTQNPILTAEGQEVSNSIRDIYFILSLVFLVFGLVWQGIRLVVMQRPQGLAVILRGLFVHFIVFSLSAFFAVLLAQATDGYVDYLHTVAVDNLGMNKSVIAQSLKLLLGASLGLVLPILLIIVTVSAYIFKLTLILYEISFVFMVGLLPFAASGQLTKTSRPWLMRLIRALIAILFYKPVAATSFIFLFLLIKSEDTTMVIAGWIAIALLPFSLPAVMRIFAFAGVGGDGSSTGGQLTDTYVKSRMMAGMADDGGDLFRFVYPNSQGKPIMEQPHGGAASPLGGASNALFAGSSLSSVLNTASRRSGHEMLKGGPGRDISKHSNVVNNGVPRRGSGRSGGAGGLGGAVSSGGGGGYAGPLAIHKQGDPRKSRLWVGGSATLYGMYAANELTTQVGSTMGRSLSGEGAMIDGYDELDINNPDGIFDAS